MPENTTPSRYTKAGIISAICADITLQVIEQANENDLIADDKLYEKLFVVVGALDKLATEEGIPADKIYSARKDYHAKLVKEVALSTAPWPVRKAKLMALRKALNLA